jgi:hypothetical protein
MYINDTNSKGANYGCLQLYVRYYIPMSVIVALLFDNCLGTARFSSVKYKASRTRVYALALYKNAFPIYRFPSRSLHPWVALAGHPSLRSEKLK